MIDPIQPATVQRIFPGAPSKNIKEHLPDVLEALREAGLYDGDMIAMAFGTIAAETARFEPISEFISKYNTERGGKPFALYDFRRDIGNCAEGDGAKYKGRGFVQLTGKDNYRRIGAAIGVDLLGNPDAANEPKTAARILAAFLKAQEARIRRVLREGDLKTARRLVNGGSHGLEPFTLAYRMSKALIH